MPREPWSTSDRRSRLPKDWHQRRARTWRAAHGQCQWVTAGQRCTWTGKINGDHGQVDHIHRGAGDHQANLQWLCPTHHTEKTTAEAATARIPRRRPTPKHPGLV